MSFLGGLGIRPKQDWRESSGVPRPRYSGMLWWRKEYGNISHKLLQNYVFFCYPLWNGFNGKLNAQRILLRLPQNVFKICACESIAVQQQQTSAINKNCVPDSHMLRLIVFVNFALCGLQIACREITCFIFFLYCLLFTLNCKVIYVVSASSSSAISCV